MKKIFEFKVFDVINNPDNEEFLKKVKKQNPDLYSRFVSLIGNKGLEFAKKKYANYDPDYWKIKNRELTKKIKIENKEQKKSEILKKYEKQINMINIILKKSILKKEIFDFMNKDKNISDSFKSYGIKKQYTNLFLSLLKKPFKLNSVFNFNAEIEIDKLEFIGLLESVDLYFDDKGKYTIIRINQFLDINDNKLLYNISFNLPTFNINSFDKDKEKEFIGSRNQYINTKLKGFSINKNELFEVINLFSHALSHEFYEEWLLKRDVKKYNL